MTTLTPTRCRRLALLLVSGALLAASCSAGSSANTLDSARSKDTLRVALTEANPPWNFLKDNKPAGYDVDVAHELAKRLGIGKVEFVGSDFGSFIGGVQAGRFDIVISGQTITDERKKQVGFSRPYEVNGVSVFVRAGNTSLTGPSSLRGRTIAVSEGTTQAEYARTKIPGARVKTYKNATLALTDVGQGRADAALVSKFQGAYLADKNNLRVRAAGSLLETEVNGMTFRKGQKDLKQKVDKALNGMIDDGTLSAISRRWLGGLDMAAELRKPPANQAG
ncbi:transporter substrate-binding domain-containing protein [Streptomyces sp. SAI-090]|jgi:cystine transport system substrate-binding protein|uniref:transporter substrate-binding domain-containing protein n=1 Tax=Streptomyces sp. SAI-090 TaxID=2940545 RepID=UPI0024734099|nr:transporter substrate-binding domain-containing protein [Streptomyces sp. SAI-090]MDH6522211.1 cystine transport system substrate-binding protein [Streptomyces sp. SAI-090]